MRLFLTSVLLPVLPRLVCCCLSLPLFAERFKHDLSRAGHSPWHRLASRLMYGVFEEPDSVFDGFDPKFFDHGVASSVR